MYTTSLYCTSALYTFSYTLSTNHKSRLRAALMLGFGDFYYELGVQIAEACINSRAQDGGAPHPALVISRYCMTECA